tara:strand:- start:440 stop:694 length:255 start_codon:yes stop_codon:yes gene_type:complete
MADITVVVGGNPSTSQLGLVSKLPVEVNLAGASALVNFTTSNIIAGTGITVIPTGVSGIGNVTTPLIWQIINDTQNPNWTIIPN